MPLTFTILYHFSDPGCVTRSETNLPCLADYGTEIFSVDQVEIETVLELFNLKILIPLSLWEYCIEYLSGRNGALVKKQKLTITNDSHWLVLRYKVLNQVKFFWLWYDGGEFDLLSRLLAGETPRIVFTCHRREMVAKKITLWYCTFFIWSWFRVCSFSILVMR